MPLRISRLCSQAERIVLLFLPNASDAKASLPEPATVDYNVVSTGWDTFIYLPRFLLLNALLDLIFMEFDKEDEIAKIRGKHGVK